MMLGIDPKVDYAFKWLFGNEKRPQPPMHLLNAVLSHEGQEPVVEIRILNPFTERMGMDDKLSILDIKARDQLGRQFNAEMQMIVPVGLRQRFLYYWAKLYTEQLQSGEDYRLLNPTMSLCFVDGVVFPDSPGYHHVFRLVDTAQDITLTEDLVIHVFELPKFDLAADQLTTPLEVWLYFLRHGDQLDPGALPAALNTPEIQEAVEVLTLLTQDYMQKEIYEGRLKARRDAQTMLNVMAETREALEETREALAETSEALAEARKAAAEALGRGVLIGQIVAFQKRLRQNLTPREELEAMPLAGLAALSAQLEREVLG